MHSQVNAFLKEQDSTSYKPMTMQEVAMGFVEVANEAMCRPIRSITQVYEHTYNAQKHKA